MKTLLTAITELLLSPNDILYGDFYRLNISSSPCIIGLLISPVNYLQNLSTSLKLLLNTKQLLMNIVNIAISPFNSEITDSL
jgi:hypothetical protein